jgi:hypothetical protein
MRLPLALETIMLAYAAAAAPVESTEAPTLKKASPSMGPGMPAKVS